MAEDSYSFDSARVRLEEIAAQVRKKDTSLEKSLDLLEEGVRLANLCTEQIDHTQWKSAVAEQPADASTAGTDTAEAPLDGAPQPEDASDDPKDGDADDAGESGHVGAGGEPAADVPSEDPDGAVAAPSDSEGAGLQA